MKNIVICFDGTWNTADAQFPTNVVKTAKLLLPADARGADQVVFYDEGVGTTRVPFAQSINNAIAGAFGIGLMDNIERAYRFLSFNYAPGDRIFIFGFSRGAFSARSFGGLLRTCGILHKEHIDKVKEAIALYQNRDREQGADAAPCVKFRNDYCFASYAPDTLLTRAFSRSPQPLAVQYIGIWDTVGALGVPGFMRFFHRKYQFHDLELSRMVKARGTRWRSTSGGSPSPPRPGPISTSSTRRQARRPRARPRRSTSNCGSRAITPPSAAAATSTACGRRRWSGWSRARSAPAWPSIRPISMSIAATSISKSPSTA